MFKKRHLLISLGLMVGLLVVGIGLVIGLVVTAQPSKEDIEKLSYSYINKVFHVKSGQPQIMAIQNTNTAGLIDYGISFGPPPKPDLPLMLVIFKGDFDDASLPGYGSFDPALPVVPFRYVGLVYDLNPNVQGPKLILSSTDGSLFKKVLNDPSLPDPTL